MDNNQPRNLPESKNEIVVYQPDGTIRLAVRLENETVWLTQAQLCELFQRDVSVISRHIKNIFSECELDKESNLHYLQIATSDRPVALYSLDVIISVGYRVKSVIGTRFRQWANRILKEYVLREAGHSDVSAVRPSDPAAFRRGTSGMRRRLAASRAPRPRRWSFPSRAAPSSRGRTANRRRGDRPRTGTPARG